MMSLKRQSSLAIAALLTVSLGSTVFSARALAQREASPTPETPQPVNPTPPTPQPVNPLPGASPSTPAGSVNSSENVVQPPQSNPSATPVVEEPNPSTTSAQPAVIESNSSQNAQGVQQGGVVRGLW